MTRVAITICVSACVLCYSCHPRDRTTRVEATTLASEIVVPKLWDAQALADWATPVAGLGVAPGFASEEEYYAAPVDNLRTYPVYHPFHEPPGYREWMKAQGPQRIIEPEKLRTKADWIAAGQRVFEGLDVPVSRIDDAEVLAYFGDADAIAAARETVTREGVLLEYRWVIDRDGGLKISLSNCATCHMRIMPDGSLLRGAPSNFDLGFAPAVEALLATLNTPGMPAKEQFYQEHAVPWRADDEHARFRTMSDEKFREFNSLENGAPTGTTFPRFNGSPLYTTRMADLNGVKDRRYLDATATHLNRGPADVARYGILVGYADVGVFGSHRFEGTQDIKLLVRPADEAMYALGLYLYSLEPPTSPYPFDELARRGQRVFEAERCGECHTPPIYTNNKLVVAEGFEPPMNDPAIRRLDISRRRVGTDPGSALKTRKGTGFYKIPSLRGLWYRGLYEHNGSVSSLEDWFDPRRLSEDYVPTGWRGPGVKSRAVPGHAFGHELSDDDKRALIAFLKTL